VLVDIQISFFVVCFFNFIFWKFFCTMAHVLPQGGGIIPTGKFDVFFIA